MPYSAVYLVGIIQRGRSVFLVTGMVYRIEKGMQVGNALILYNTDINTRVPVLLYLYLYNRAYGTVQYYHNAYYL